MNLPTPLGTDQYSRFQADVFDERKVIGVPTGFQSFFGRPETGAMTLFAPNALVVDIDIIRGNEKTAKMIMRGGNGRIIDAGQENTNEQKYSNFNRLFPLIEEEGDFNAAQINNRVAGENPFQNMSPLDRLRVLATNTHMEHVRRTVRTFEVLAAQSVIEGQMDAIIGTSNTDMIYDFRRATGNTITVGTGWNQASPTIIADIDGACDQMREQGHVNPDMMIVGGQAMDAFINDTDVQTQADNRRFELIEVSTNNPVPERFARFVAGGFTPRGRLRTPKGYELWLFTYTDVYTNDAGTAVKYMPEDKAVLAYSGARCDRYFGPSETLPMTAQRVAFYQEFFGFNPLAAPMPPNIKNVASIINPAMFYFDAYVAANMKTVTARTQAAPIFVTTATDMFVTLQGLIT